MTVGHRHKMDFESGPYGCAGGVSYTQFCACGCRRTVCTCTQCESQGTSRGAWEMPVCIACNLRHPTDQSCPVPRT